MGNNLVERAKALFAELASVPESERVELLNAIRLALHEYSPLKSEPIDCVLWIESEAVQANDYNPNVVAPPEMELLRLSIQEDGYTQPIVAYPENGGYTVVDGFHRNRVFPFLFLFYRLLLFHFHKQKGLQLYLVKT